MAYFLVTHPDMFAERRSTFTEVQKYMDRLVKEEITENVTVQKFIEQIDKKGNKTGINVLQAQFTYDYFDELEVWLKRD